MKISQFCLLAACAPALSSARFIETHEEDQVMLNGISEERFLIETAPGEAQWVTEDEKWELRRNGQNFMDITNHPDLSLKAFANKKPKGSFPTHCTKQDEVKPHLSKLSKDKMRENLERLTKFYTRYYKSDYGLQSSQWVLQKVNDIIKEAGATEFASAKPFDHPWNQKSVIVTIPGQTNHTVVIGAHQDSINLLLPSILAAPGADDDGSGTVTIMEVMRVLLESGLVGGHMQLNGAEFHFYSAEEGGLLGSQAIFERYAEEGRDVVAMLQQDMTGYIQTTLDNGKPESVGVIVDYVDKDLTNFIKTVIDEYCDIPWCETECGYACSDHASASKAGYRSAFVIESAFSDSSQHIHSTDDRIEYLSFDHMLQHAQMTLGLVIELLNFDFSSESSPGEL